MDSTIFASWIVLLSLIVFWMTFKGRFIFLFNVLFSLSPSFLLMIHLHIPCGICYDSQSCPHFHALASLSLYLFLFHSLSLSLSLSFSILTLAPLSPSYLSLYSIRKFTVADFSNANSLFSYNAIRKSPFREK